MIEREVEERAAVVDDAIDELDFDGGPAEDLHDAARHLLTAGGKRLRPVVVLLVNEAYDGDQRDALPAAVAVEITHSFTLIHDDIMDDDPVRRGEPSVHVKWNESTAILTGDFLYSKAFEQVLDDVHPPEKQNRMLRVLAETCTRICEGQSVDIDGAVDSEDEYMEMVEMKTGVLFAAAAALGGHAADASQAEVEKLHEFGVKIGKAFQIHDDVLDLTTSSEDLGKRRGSDLVERKPTLVALHAETQGVDPYVSPDADEAEIERKVDELHESGSIEYANTRARDLVDEAKDAVDVLPETEARRHLREIAELMVSREH